MSTSTALSRVVDRSRPGRVHIVDSRFEKLGKLGRAHGIYMGIEGELVIEDSDVLAATSWGTEIKSRAPLTRVIRSTIASIGSNHSRLLDIPHGGLLMIEDLSCSMDQHRPKKLRLVSGWRESCTHSNASKCAAIS
ncbi:MAG: hypothetical protein H6962_13210 [Chromatiaceae bacterium]|nr:hypothetical protein [Chromatiaceae bacterium]